MPRVVIEIQANTQDAVNKIQQFARAQRDAFDAVKAGNPSLQDAYIKVSKLTEGTGAAAKSTQDFNRAAKDLAKGGVRELINDIPVLGGTLSKLAGTLGGFPLLIAGIVGAGVGLLKFLDDMNVKATAALNSVTALAKGMADAQAIANLNVARIRAGAAGNEAGALMFGAEGAKRSALRAEEQTIEAARAKAESERPGLLSLEGLAGVITSGGKLGADAKFQAEVDEKVNNARKAAKQKSALEIFEIEAQLKADLKKLEDDYDKRLEDGQDKRVKDAEDAAAKQEKILADLSTKSLAIFKGLGEDFKGVTQSLELAQFLKDSAEAINTLQQSFAQGLISQEAYTQGTQALTEKMEEATRLGFVPAAKAIASAGAAAEQATMDFAAMAAAAVSAGAALGALDVARARAGAQSSLGITPGMSIAEASATGNRSLYEQARLSSFSATLSEAQGVLGTYSSVSRPYTSTPIDAPSSFQHGGIVPGSGPVPIIAHGGEQILPAGGRSGSGGGGVRIEAGAIQIHGTVIDQGRAWGVLVEELGQALAARGR